MRTNLKVWLKRLKDEGTRHLAKLVLGSTKPADVEDVPDLVEALKSRDSERRLWASVALAGIGPKAEAAIPALADLLHHDPAFGNRQAAAYALARIGVGLHLTVPRWPKRWRMAIRSCARRSLARWERLGHPMPSRR